MDKAAELDTHKLSLARLWAVRRHPYLTAAIFASPVISAPGLGKAALDESWRLYIDPAVCIDCGACEPACPVQAIFPEDLVPEKWTQYTKINADYFVGSS